MLTVVETPMFQKQWLLYWTEEQRGVFAAYIRVRPPISRRAHMPAPLVRPLRQMISDLTPDQFRLAAYMSALSEAGWHSTWQLGLKEALWAAMHNGPKMLGQMLLTEEQLGELRSLSSQCNGWIRFDEDHEEVFVPSRQWIDQQKNG